MQQGITDGIKKFFKRKDKPKPDIKTINEVNEFPNNNASSSKIYRPNKRGKNRMIQSSNSFLKHSIRATKAWL